MFHICSRGQENSLYCEFEDNENFVEFYDLNFDPFQLENGADILTEGVVAFLKARMYSMAQCKGSECSRGLFLALSVGTFNAIGFMLIVVVLALIIYFCVI